MAPHFAHHAPKPNGSEENGIDETAKAKDRLIGIWTWVGAIVLAAVALYLAGLITNAIGIIIWTVVFVFILRGPVNWLDQHGVNRGIGTLIAYILFFCVIGLVVFAVFSPLFGINTQFEDLAKSLPTYIDALQRWTTGLYDQYSDVLQSPAAREWLTNTMSSVGGFAQSLAANTASGMVAAGTSIANIAMCIGFALVIAYWMLADLPKLGREAFRLIDEKYHEDAQMIHLTITRVMGGYIKATLVQCGLIGAICGVMFAILGVPSPAAIAVITGLLNIIPIVGPWLGGMIAFTASLLTSPLVGLISLIGTIIIQQVIYTFVSPKLMSESVDIHPALTFIALMAGSGIGAAAGGLTGSLVGALLSIPLVAIGKSLFVYYFEKKTGRRIVSEDGVFFKGAPAKEGSFDPVTDATGPIPIEMANSANLLAGLSGKLPKIEPDDKSDDK